MKFKCLVTLGLVVAVQSATIFSNPIDIPVKADIVGRGNLDAKVQLSLAELRQVPKQQENEYHGNSNSIRNLDEKVQLSSEELLQADKHLPLDEGVLKANSVEEEQKPQPAEASKPGENELLDESSEKPSSTQPSLPSPTTEENLPDPNYVLLIQIAQNIVFNGLTTIRDNIDNLSTNGEANKNPPISSEQWHRLNQTISDFFSTLLQTGSLKSGNEFVLKRIVAGVGSATNNFVENLRQANATQNVQAQRPGIGQNIINMITAGFNRITSNINSIPYQSTTKNTVLGDGEQSTPAPAAPGPIQTIINQVQQFFGVSTAAPGSQGDEGSTPAPTLPFQNVANQVGQVINNFNPFRPTVATAATPAPGSQGDSPTTVNPLEPFQNAANQVGQAINNLNPFRPTVATAAPGSQGDDPTTASPFLPFQNAANQVGQAINNLNPFRPTPAPGAQNEGSTSGPFQNVISQIGQVVNNFNPFNPTPAPGAANEEGTPATQGPIQQGFQNFANQVGSVINNLNPFNQPSTPAAVQSEGSTPNTPLQEVQNQIGQAISGLNPLNQLSTLTPLEDIQNAVSQAGQAISTFNPLTQASSLIPANNPLENVVSQVGQAAGSFNPVNQALGSTLPPVSGSIQTIQTIGNQGQQLIQGQNPINLPVVVETIPSISSEIVPEKVKTNHGVSDDEIMLAVD